MKTEVFEHQSSPIPNELENQRKIYRSTPWKTEKVDMIEDLQRNVYSNSTLTVGSNTWFWENYIKSDSIRQPGIS